MSNWDQWNNKNDDQSYGQQGYGHPGHAQQGYDQQGYGDYAGAQAMSEGYAHSMFAADAAKSDRMAFIQKTYLHLGLAILAFVIVEVIALKVIAPMIGEQVLMGWFFSGYNMLILVGAFIGISFLADMWAKSNTSPAMQYAGLGIYVLAEAVIFMPLLLIAENFYPGAIGTAGIATLAIFGTLTAFVFISKADFSFMGPFLAICGIAALATIVASIIMGTGLGVWFTGLMILFAGGYILYDTSNIMHHYRTDQHVAASLALFASVAMLFWYVLRLVMAMRE